MSSTEQIVVALVALMLTVASVILVRRELVLHARTSERWWRVDASAAGAFFTTLAAIGAWVAVAQDEAPGAGELVAYLAVALVLLAAGARGR